MSFGNTVRRVAVTLVLVGFLQVLQGCGETPPPADETHKIAAPIPPKPIQEIRKDQGKLIPKSIKKNQQ
jgi:hypothetical protein